MVRLEFIVARENGIGFTAPITTSNAQLRYLERLKKIPEDDMRRFIQGMEMPEEFRPKPKVELPPFDPNRREFRILDYVRPARKTVWELLDAVPLVRRTRPRSERRQSRNLGSRSAPLSLLGRMF